MVSGGAEIVILMLAPKVIARGLGRKGKCSCVRVGVSGLAGDNGPERMRRLEGSKGAKRGL